MGIDKTVAVAPTDKVRRFSVDALRLRTVILARGAFVLAVAPAMMIFQVVVAHLAKHGTTSLVALVRPDLVMLVVLASLALAFMIRCGQRNSPRCLRMLIGACFVFGVLCSVYFVRRFPSVSRLAEEFERWPETMAVVRLTFGALLWAMVVGMGYWAVFLPARAAWELLSDQPHCSAVSARSVDQRAPAATRENLRSVAYRVATVVLALVTAVGVVWSFALGYGLVGFAVELVVIQVCLKLWRRARRHAAIDANELLAADPRRPVLYLRSFADDTERLQAEFGAVFSISDVPRRPNRVMRWLAAAPSETSGGVRLEEALAAEVVNVGPFVAIGAPGEPLAQLGATRAYFSDDSWQAAVTDWIDRSQLIITSAGPSEWIRWELATILGRHALTRLIIVMPPFDDDERWRNVLATVAGTPWQGSVAELDRADLLAFRFLPGGRIVTVTGMLRRHMDYMLAIRVLLREGPSSVCVQAPDDQI